MAKAKTTIKIDGEKLRSLLEDKTGKTIYQIAEESGYSKNVLSNAIHNGYASSAVQNIARLYEIYPEAYKILEFKHKDEELKGQISIDDIEGLKRNELKEIVKQAIREESLKSKELKPLIKEAVVEVMLSLPYVRVSGIDYDPKNKRFKLLVCEEDLK